MVSDRSTHSVRFVMQARLGQLERDALLTRRYIEASRGVAMVASVVGCIPCVASVVVVVE